jgi:hypothetical protein
MSNTIFFNIQGMELVKNTVSLPTGCIQFFFEKKSNLNESDTTNWFIWSPLSFVSVHALYPQFFYKKTVPYIHNGQ